MRRFRLAVTVAGPLAAALVLGIAPPAAAAPHRPAPVPGAPGIGDPLFPDLGNGGYDVARYGIEMTYRGPHQIEGVTTVEARTTQALSRFDLDFDGNVVRAVTVDGRRAAWTRQGAELIVTPRRALRQGARFSVRVAYTADPAGTHACPTPPPLVGSAWFPTPDGGFVTAGQPNCMHTVFPSNDHPRDKASYRFTLTVPNALTAVANGSLVRRVRHGATTTWTYREDDPMATELVQIAIGDYTVLTHRGPRGILVRHVVPTDRVAEIAPQLATEDGHLAWLEGKVGRYPFDEYGVLAAKLPLGFALETQTLSLFPDFLWGPQYPASVLEAVEVHELAHQWFGDSVAPEKWADVWLNEGHATWYDATYSDERGWASFTDRMRAAYAAGDRYRATWGPVASPPAADLFNDNVYNGGALVLYALRQQVGTAAFGRIERAWVRTYRGSVAGTPDFIRLASRVSGQDLTAFLTAWLYGTATPPMPGHPDWTVDPVTTPAAAAAAASLSAAPVGRR